MYPSIRCNGFELTDAIREAVESRLEKVSHRSHGITLSANLEKETEDEYRVHVEYVTAHKGTINATAKGKDLYVTIHDAQNKLIRQLNDNLEREKGKHRGPRIGSQLPTLG